jgi:hypothetical protein
MNAEEERLFKQNLLKEEILGNGFDKEMFITFMEKEKKGGNLNNLLFLKTFVILRFEHR